MSDKPELKPCPFCGKQPTTYWDFTPGEDEVYWEGYNIKCCCVDICRTEKVIAIEAWNQRADLAKPSEWISVDDRLPELDKKVLVFCKRYPRFGYMYSRNNWRVKFGFDYIIGDDVTHWQPLPPPPTRETP